MLHISFASFKSFTGATSAGLWQIISVNTSNVAALARKRVILFVVIAALLLFWG